MAGILDPITIRNHTIKNRVVLPPIVVFRAGEDGKVTDWHVSHYKRRALGGCGLIIVEAVCVAPEGRGTGAQLGIWADDMVAGLERISRVCGEEGAATLVQIHHGGLKASLEFTDQRIGPSDYRDEERSARAMTLDEIAEIRDAFIQAAVRAYRAGFDGVELHGAHGFLLSQFASSLVNQRTDEYGGDVSGRLRLVRQIIEGIRQSVTDPGFIVTCRMGCNEPDLAHGVEIAKALEGYGVDALHVSSGFEGGSEPVPPDSFPGSWIAWGGAEIRANVTVPVIGVSGIRTHDQAAALLDGHLDMVALARGLLVDPDWALKAADGRDIISCVECKPRCRWFEDACSCPRYQQEWEQT